MSAIGTNTKSSKEVSKLKIKYAESDSNLLSDTSSEILFTIFGRTVVFHSRSC